MEITDAPFIIVFTITAITKTVELIPHTAIMVTDIPIIGDTITAIDITEMEIIGVVIGTTTIGIMVAIQIGTMVVIGMVGIMAVLVDMAVMDIIKNYRI